MSCSAGISLLPLESSLAITIIFRLSEELEISSVENNTYMCILRRLSQLSFISLVLHSAIWLHALICASLHVCFVRRITAYGCA